MDAELERLRRENARLRKERDEILTGRNHFLSEIQKERTRNTEMSNQILALDSEKNDLARTNQELSEKLELALSAKTVADRALSKSKPRSSRARKQIIVISDDEEENSVQAKAEEMKVEAPSPTRAEERPPQEGPPPERSVLEESDNDDPFAQDFELLPQQDQLSGDDAVNGNRVDADMDETGSEAAMVVDPPPTNNDTKPTFSPSPSVDWKRGTKTSNEESGLITPQDALSSTPSDLEKHRLPAPRQSSRDTGSDYSTTSALSCRITRGPGSSSVSAKPLPRRSKPEPAKRTRGQESSEDEEEMDPSKDKPSVERTKTAAPRCKPQRATGVSDDSGPERPAAPPHNKLSEGNNGAFVQNPANVDVDVLEDEDFDTMDIDKSVREVSPDESDPPALPKPTKDKGKGRAPEPTKKDESKTAKSKSKKLPRDTDSEGEPEPTTSSKGKARARPPAKKQKQRDVSPEASDASQVRTKNLCRPLKAGNNSSGVQRWISGACIPCEDKPCKCVFGFYKGIDGNRRFSCDECLQRKVKCVKHPLAQGQLGFLPPSQDEFLQGPQEFLGCGEEEVPRSGAHLPQAEFLATPSRTTRIAGTATILQLSQTRIQDLEQGHKKMKKHIKQLELCLSVLEGEKVEKGKKKSKKDDKGKGKCVKVPLEPGQDEHLPTDQEEDLSGEESNVPAWTRQTSGASLNRARLDELEQKVEEQRKVIKKLIKKGKKHARDAEQLSGSPSKKSKKNKDKY
ncbi:hypothetical protein BDZ89DRAFT_1118155 [Hymenopellis radicata]|nr:hypothetical protein BDZ89DRAFT_1118155 [Hymenopellis radicata]